MSLKDEQSIISVDARGQVCPYPLITARKHLKQMKSGEVLKLEVDYGESALKSIPEWCKKNNVPFEVVEVEDRLWYIYIKKA
jgi:TusA-related sulfurtransferase